MCQTASLHTLKFLNVMKFCESNIKDGEKPRCSSDEYKWNKWNIWVTIKERKRKRKILMHNNTFPTVQLMMPVFMNINFPYVFKILCSQSKNGLHAEGVEIY